MTSRPVQRPPPDSDPTSDDPLDDTGHGEADVRVDYDPRAGFDARSSFERILPELIRRGLEAGRGPLEKVSESIFPKDLASQLVAQLGDVRSGIVKAVAHEVGRFLRDADIASELRKVLTGLDVDAHVRLRFKARDDGSLKPEIDIDLGSGHDDKSRPRKPRG
jgi:hypothetical protein